MNIKNFDLNLLLVFKTLFEERNVTKASKKMGITQPAMSNALNRLRYLVKDSSTLESPSYSGIFTVLPILLPPQCPVLFNMEFWWAPPPMLQ